MAGERSEVGHGKDEDGQEVDGAERGENKEVEQDAEEAF